MFGAEVRVCGPATLLPRCVEKLGVKVFNRLEPALEGADVIYLLRIQLERLTGAPIPSLREYSRTFGVSERHLALAAENAIVMHPGPLNRGVEIHPALADGQKSAVLNQVEAGVAVRMAVLYLLASGRGTESVREAAGET
jgi:aspartate carbamoyltransferase catalytic subunit